MQYAPNEAKKCVEKSTKKYKDIYALQKTSFFALRFEPDWEEVARKSKVEIADLRRCGNIGLDLLIDYLQLSSEANERLNLLNYAGTDLEELGGVCSKRIAAAISGEYPLTDSKIEELKSLLYNSYKRADDIFVVNGQIDRATGIALRAAKQALEYGNTQKAMEFYESVFEVYESQNKPASCESPCKEAIKFYLQQQNYDKAIELYTRLSNLYQSRLDIYIHDIHQIYLSIAIILIYKGDYDTLVLKLNEWNEERETKFVDSSESGICHALLSAAAQNDEAFTNAVKSNPGIIQLDNNVSRLVKAVKVEPSKALSALNKMTNIQLNLDEDVAPVEQQLDDLAL